MLISIRSEYGKIQRHVRKQRRVVHRATNDALNRTLDNVYTRTIKAVNAQTEVKQKLLRGRIRKYPSRDYTIKQPAMWLGTLRYKLSDLGKGKIQANDTGVGLGRAGKFNIAGAFVINWRSGSGVYRRVGPRRWDIRVVYYDISKESNAIARLIIRSPFTHRVFEKTFKRRLEYLSQRK